MTIEYTYEQLLAMAENIVATSANGDGHEPDGGLEMLIDWPTFWDAERTEEEWLAHPILAADRSHAMFAPGGTGKSLLALWLAAALATGRPIFGNRQEPRDVLYLDYEMTEDDLAERLSDMGYGPEDDMSHLHYALLPSLPGLDKPEGGKAVVQLAEACSAELVVIDTFGRAVHGDENEADTVRAWYRWTGIHLKAAGRAFLRVDHAGKDIDKGQRGTSAKNDDVDVVWKLTRQDAGAFKLTAKKKRMQWVPDAVELLRRDEDGVLTYAMLAGKGWPAGTKDLADVLDRLGVPVDISVRTAREALKQADQKATQAVLSAAVKYRREGRNAARNADLAYRTETPTVTESTNGNIPGHEGRNAARNGSSRTPESNSVPPPPYRAVTEDHPSSLNPDPEEIF